MFTCDAESVIQKAVTQFKEQVKYPIILSPNANENTIACIKPSELSAVIDNLLHNAVRAMTNTSDRKITIKTKTIDRYFLIEFTDTGIGISKKLWHKIFEANYSTKLSKKGGFGLFYSRQVLEKYGGSIEVLKSGKNKGTTFLVKLKII